MYFVRTKDANLFEEFNIKHNKILSAFDKNYGDNNSLVNKTKGRLRIIDFSNYDSVCLYYAQLLGKYFCFGMCWSKINKMKKTFNVGYERLNEEMDLIQIIKTIRDLKVLLKHFSHFQEIESSIKSNKYNVIELEEDSLELENSLNTKHY